MYYLIKNVIKDSSILIEEINKKASFFTNTTVTGNIKNYRISKTIQTTSLIDNIFSHYLYKYIPTAKELLDLEFEEKSIYKEIVVTETGGYFKVHKDNNCPQTKHRKLTFVYYLKREEDSFTGGDLVLYSKYPDQYTVIKPENNSIIFFSSSLDHEVLPVTSVKNNEFINSRFTINGWIS